MFSLPHRLDEAGEQLKFFFLGDGTLVDVVDSDVWFPSNKSLNCSVQGNV